MKRFFFILVYVFISFNSNSQNVGISDVLFTPQSPLHIYKSADGNLLQLSNSTAANSGFQISVTGNNYELINRQAGYLSLWTSNTERFRINNLGYTGVRTMFPNSWLHIDGDGVTTTFRVQNNGSSKLTVGTNGGVTIGTFNDTPPVNGLYVFGNTGIGVASPTSKFHVNGTVRFENLSAPAGETTALVIDASGNVKGRVLDAVAFNGFTETDPSAWSLTGNGGTVDGVNFIGTTDNVPLDIRVNNEKSGRISSDGITSYGYQAANANTSTYCSAFGFQALYNNTSGSNNSSFGAFSLNSNTTGGGNTAVGFSALSSNTIGYQNTAIGSSSMQNNTTGHQNTAVGDQSMVGNSTGSNNTSVGHMTMTQNTSGSENSSIGMMTLYNNTTGSYNNAFGVQALYHNSTGSHNAAIGHQSLYNNTTGNLNTAIGSYSLYNNTTGVLNTAAGYQSMFTNQTGYGNSAFGVISLFSNTTGIRNCAFGDGCMYLNTEGSYNTASGMYSLYDNTTGSNNSSYGYLSLISNTTGNYNIAVGVSSMASNTTGNNNIAIGANAMNSNTTACLNIAIGDSALFTQSYGVSQWNSQNIAIGFKALYSNQPTFTSNGFYNVAIGNFAMVSNTTGRYNTSTGSRSLFNNTSGYENTAVGFNSLMANITGYSNTSVGSFSMLLNNTGRLNTSCGYYALSSNTSGYSNTSIGSYSMSTNETGFGNVAVGYAAGDFGNFTREGTFIGLGAYPAANGLANVGGFGYNARPTASNSIRIGNTSVTSIGGYAAWTNYSDEKFKKNIRENVPGLEFIMQLRPVTYQIAVGELSEFLEEDKTRDENGNIVFATSDDDRQARSEKEAVFYTGFIAQEVETAAITCGYDFSGIDKPTNEQSLYGLRYAEFVVPLVKATQEQQLIIEEQQRQIDELKTMVLKQQEQINMLIESQLNTGYQE